MATVIQGATYRAEIIAAISNQAISPKIERSDEEINRRALVALRTNLCIPAERIMVIVINGSVTLEGSVQFNVQRMLAESLMRRLGGITSVRNRIEVRPEDFIRATKLEIEEDAGD